MRQKYTAPTKYVNFEIKNGRFYEYCGPGVPPEEYKKLGGILISIKPVNKNFDGRDVLYININLFDREDNSNYVIECPAYYGAGPNILRSLAQAVEDKKEINTSEIVIDVYSIRKQDKSYTNATVYLGEEKLKWASLPEGANREDLQAHYDGLIQKVNDYLKKQNPVVEDLPDDGSYNPFNR